MLIDHGTATLDAQIRCEAIRAALDVDELSAQIWRHG
jgi:hypothetical protein